MSFLLAWDMYKASHVSLTEEGEEEESDDSLLKSESQQAARQVFESTLTDTARERYHYHIDRLGMQPLSYFENPAGL